MPNAQPPIAASSTTEAPARVAACFKCGRPVDAAHKFCPHCGQRLEKATPWYYEPVWILVLAFIVIGPLALFLVWKTPKMGRVAKLVVTALIVLYTVYGAYYFYKLTAFEMKQLQELDTIMRQTSR